MTVLELLEEIEDIVDTATGVPLTGKIMIDANDLLEVVRSIRLSLPDDVQQAKWVKEEKERILSDAKVEYEKIIKEAKKQASYLVDTHEITLKAQQKGEEIRGETEEYCKFLKMRTYEYVDKVLYDMQTKMDDLNMKYLGEMFGQLEQSFGSIGEILQNNREEIKQMAYRTQNGDDILAEVSDPQEEA